MRERFPIPPFQMPGWDEFGCFDVPPDQPPAIAELNVPLHQMVVVVLGLVGEREILAALLPHQSENLSDSELSKAVRTIATALNDSLVLGICGLFEMGSKEPNLRSVLKHLTNPKVTPILSKWHQGLRSINVERETQRLVQMQKRLKRGMAHDSLKTITATRNSVLAHLHYSQGLPCDLPTILDLYRMVVLGANITATALRLLTRRSALNHKCRELGRLQADALVAALTGQHRKPPK